MKFYICESFVNELKKVTEKYRDVEINSYKSKCKYQHINEPFKNIENSDENFYILGGCSLEKNNLTSNLKLKKEESCFHMFAPKTLVNSYIEDGAYIVTPGWLNQWKSYVKNFWGFDSKTATNFFDEFCTKIVLFDTLREEKSINDIKEFSSFVGKTYEILPIGLEYFNLYIENIIEKDTANKESQKNKKKLNDALQNMSNYAVAFDFVSKLNEKFDEKEIVDKIIESFIMLFAPENITYLMIKNSKIIETISLKTSSCSMKNRLLKIKDNYILEDEGFAIKLSYQNVIVGIVCVEKIAFVQYIEKYLNLAISISEVCALAVENARNYLKTQEIEAQLVQHAKLVSMGEMIGMIAHQWRQPLSIVSMSSNNILVDIELNILENKSLKKYAQDIVDKTQELSKTIDDFRNFFQSDKESEEVLIENVINNTLGIIGKSLENNKILLDIHYGTKKTIKVYYRELMQVIINILNNANEAFMESKIENKKISVNIEDYKSGIIIKICDNAGGIKENILDKIFDPYFSTKNGKNGTGLGLYMSKTIIESHLYGSLTAKNITGGVCFNIKIPQNIK